MSNVSFVDLVAIIEGVNDTELLAKQIESSVPINIGSPFVHTEQKDHKVEVHLGILYDWEEMDINVLRIKIDLFEDWLDQMAEKLKFGYELVIRLDTEN